MTTTPRIGVLTAGGDCPGLNAVIRGVVKSANMHGYEVVGFLKGYEGLVDPVSFIPLTHKNTAGILSQGGTILGSTNKGRFAATVGVNDRQELDPELVAGVKTTVEQLGLAGLICIGGDGSLAVSQQFHEQGIPVVGVPKTIDNDLSSTAFTFGFFSAVFCATDALDRLHTTAASHERVMVLEVMGRHAGWIALYAGIAGGGDVILIPEIVDVEYVSTDFDRERRQAARDRRGRGPSFPAATRDRSRRRPPDAAGGIGMWWRPRSNRGRNARPASPCSAICSAAGRRRPSTACWPLSLGPMPCGSWKKAASARWSATSRRRSRACRSRRP
jgi:6-phosphofructokinase